MKEITLENLLKTEEYVSGCTADIDEVLRETSNTADTLNRIQELIAESDEDTDLVQERLNELTKWQEENTTFLKYQSRDYFKALVWLVKNTTICEQVAAKFHDTLKFNVERASEKMLAVIKEYEYYEERSDDC